MTALLLEQSTVAHPVATSTQRGIVSDPIASESWSGPTRSASRHRQTLDLDQPSLCRAQRVAKLVSSMDAALRIWRYRHRVQEVWRKRSLHGVHLLTVEEHIPPYIWIKRTEATKLRTRVRGGIRCFLGWSTFSVLRERGKEKQAARDGTVGSVHGTSTSSDIHRPGDRDSEHRHGVTTSVGSRVEERVAVPSTRASEQCPFCGVELTVPHLIRDCGYLEDQRMRVWKDAWAAAVAKGVAGNATVYDPSLTLSKEARHQWYMLTIGEEVSASFLRIGLEGWRYAKATVHRNDDVRNGGAALLPHLGVYGALLAITGSLLRTVAAAVAAEVEKPEQETIPTGAQPRRTEKGETASSGSDTASDHDAMHQCG